MVFKRRNKGYTDEDIISPIGGTIIPVEEVKDMVFAKQLMGQTIAIQPYVKQLTLVSPANGRLEVLYPTGHAYAVRMSNGMALLVHIGIDTVELNGKGFKTLVKQGVMIKAGQPIVKVNFNLLSEAGYETSTMVIVTESPNTEKIRFKEKQKIEALDNLLI